MSCLKLSDFADYSSFMLVDIVVRRWTSNSTETKIEEQVFPPDINLFQDSGFQGYEPPGVTIHQPKKKPKGQELTAEEKAENQIISSIRIVVEHIISGVKRCRIVKDIFRNTKAFFADQVMEIACGLHNFRTTLRDQALE